MRAADNHRDGNDRDAELEDAVFDALGAVYDLPPDRAVETASFVAGQIAAFLADVARLSGDSDEAKLARDALDDIAVTCRDMLEETDDAATTAARALARIEEIGARITASPLAICNRLD